METKQAAKQAEYAPAQRCGKFHVVHLRLMRMATVKVQPEAENQDAERQVARQPTVLKRFGPWKGPTNHVPLSYSASVVGKADPEQWKAKSECPEYTKETGSPEEYVQ